MLIFAQSKKSFQKNSRRRSSFMFRWFRSSAFRQSNATLFINKKKQVNKFTCYQRCTQDSNLQTLSGKRFSRPRPHSPDMQHIADTPPPEPLQWIHPSVLLEIILSDCSVATSFYTYNGAETITIYVSLTFHLN